MHIRTFAISMPVFTCCTCTSSRTQFVSAAACTCDEMFCIKIVRKMHCLYMVQSEHDKSTHNICIIAYTYIEINYLQYKMHTFYSSVRRLY